MRAAIIGAKGQLGSDLVSRLGQQAIPLSHSAIDITDPGSIWNVLDHERPDTVINCAAYNFVDKAETDRESAMLTNRRGPGFLADYCREHDIKLMHVGTDYVFDGQNGQTTVDRRSTNHSPSVRMRRASWPASSWSACIARAISWSEPADFMDETRQPAKETLSRQFCDWGARGPN